MMGVYLPKLRLYVTSQQKNVHDAYRYYVINTVFVITAIIQRINFFSQ